MNRLKAYLAIIKGEFLVSISYIAYSYASIIASFTQIVIFYFIWKSVYNGRMQINGYSYDDILAYVVLGRILITMFNWGVNQYISDLIRTGTIGVRLLFPTNFVMTLYCAGIGNNFISNILFGGIPTLVFSMLILKVSLPYLSFNYVLFGISVFLGFTIMFLFDFLIGIFNFWTESGWAIQTIKSALLKFFSGSLIPISFFPKYLAMIANILPFKAVVDGPINILLGKYETMQAVRYLGYQSVWIVILGILVKLFFDRAVKEINIYGG